MPRAAKSGGFGMVGLSSPPRDRVRRRSPGAAESILRPLRRFASSRASVGSTPIAILITLAFCRASRRPLGGVLTAAEGKNRGGPIRLARPFGSVQPIPPSHSRNRKKRATHLAEPRRPSDAGGRPESALSGRGRKNGRFVAVKVDVKVDGAIHAHPQLPCPCSRTPRKPRHP